MERPYRFADLPHVLGRDRDQRYGEQNALISVLRSWRRGGDPEWLPHLAADSNMWVRCQVAEHPKVPPEVLRRLSTDETEAVRWRTAEHPHAPPDALQHLVADPAWQTRIVVAGNPNTPPDVTVGLYRNDPDGDARFAASRNPNLPTSEPTKPGRLPPRIVDLINEVGECAGLPDH